MKKKVLVILATLVACIAFVFAFAGCSENGSSENGSSGTEKINYAETVLVPYDEGPRIGMVYYFKYTDYGYTIDCNDKSYTIADLTGQSMPYNNYATFTFSWKTSNYKITKIEFDITTQDSLNTVLYLDNTSQQNPNNIYSKNINIQAGKTEHITIECKLTSNAYIYLANNMSTEEYSNGSYCTAKWKLSNLFITAEKI